MRAISCLLLSAAMALPAGAWAGAPSAVPAAQMKKAPKCLFPKTRKRAPEWVCSAHGDGLAIAAVGSFAKSGAGNSFMEQMAAADARVHLAQKLRSAVRSRIAGHEGAAKAARSRRDDALVTKITNESLRGTKIVESAYAPDGKLYVMVGLDEAGAQSMIESISADYLAQRRR